VTHQSGVERRQLSKDCITIFRFGHIFACVNCRGSIAIVFEVKRKKNVLPYRIITIYLRAVHSTSHLPKLYEFIRKNALGLLSTLLPYGEHPLIQSSHIPWIIEAPNYEDDGDEDALAREAKGLPLGVLRGHLSRANPQAKAIIEAAQKQAGAKPDANGRMRFLDGPVTLPEEVLVMFTGIEHYVTPKFYTATKPATGKVVPTWNY